MNNEEKRQEQQEQEEYQKWMDELDKLPFIERAVRMKDKILESDELQAADKKFFETCFEYVCDLHRKGKDLDCNLLKIHMGLKGFNEQQPQKMEQFIRPLMLLSLCGFQFEYMGRDK